MKKLSSTQWIIITMILMILAYAVIHAILIFAWMIKIGVIAAAVVAAVILYFKVKKWLRGDQ
jgi:Na+/proline symporter